MPLSTNFSSCLFLPAKGLLRTSLPSPHILPRQYHLLHLVFALQGKKFSSFAQGHGGNEHGGRFTPGPWSVCKVQSRILPTAQEQLTGLERQTEVRRSVPGCPQPRDSTKPPWAMRVLVSNQKKNRAHGTCDLQLANLLLPGPPASSWPTCFSLSLDSPEGNPRHLISFLSYYGSFRNRKASHKMTHSQLTIVFQGSLYIPQSSVISRVHFQESSLWVLLSHPDTPLFLWEFFLFFISTAGTAIFSMFVQSDLSALHFQLACITKWESCLIDSMLLGHFKVHPSIHL